MDYELFEASPKAQARIETLDDKVGIRESDHHNVKYPFGRMKIGQCFTVPIDLMEESSLRNLASVSSKRHGKRFIVIKHKEHRLFEIARIA